MIKLLQTYETRSGNIVEIISAVEWNWGTQYNGDNGWSYSDIGEAYYVKMHVGKMRLKEHDIILNKEEL